SPQDLVPTSKTQVDLQRKREQPVGRASMILAPLRRKSADEFLRGLARKRTAPRHHRHVNHAEPVKTHGEAVAIGPDAAEFEVPLVRSKRIARRLQRRLPPSQP